MPQKQHLYAEPGLAEIVRFPPPEPQPQPKAAPQAPGSGPGPPAAPALTGDRQRQHWPEGLSCPSDHFLSLNILRGGPEGCKTPSDARG